MSTSKNSAFILLIVGSIFWFIKSIFDLAIVGYYQIEYGEAYGSYLTFDYLTGPILEIVASLLVMIGFIVLRSQSAKTSQSASYSVFPSATYTPQVSSPRVCPNCGRQVVSEAKFCPFCGWQVGTQGK